VLETSEELYETEYPAIIGGLNNLAHFYAKRRRFIEAEPLARRALNLAEKHWGSENPDTSVMLTMLGGICKNQGKHEEAKLFYEKALTIRRPFQIGGKSLAYYKSTTLLFFAA
jgi:tetratricopeptide (TPR) repeat protein